VTGVVPGALLSDTASSSIFSLIVVDAWKNTKSLTVLGIGLVVVIRIS
jgi:hypothetical protein